MINKKLLLIACGGTISSTGDIKSGVKPVLDGDQLLETIEQYIRPPQIDTHQFSQQSSCEMRSADVIELAQLIAQSHYDGYLVTQGTDSLEETAFALDLLYKGAAPIVVTGAMRHPSLAGADGTANIIAAMTTALSESAQNQGVLVCLNDTVHAARFVRKAHSSRPDAFISANNIQLGWISENRYLSLTKLSRLDFEQPDKNQLASVQIIKPHSGDDGSLLKLMHDNRFCDGVIIEALGGGHVSQAMAEQIEICAKDMLIMVASRTENGTTMQSTYGCPGSELDLQNKGALFSGWLSAIKARLLLQFLLSQQLSREQIKNKFKQFH